MSYNKLWVDKYLPKNSKEIIGNSKEIKWIRNWISHFQGNGTFPNFKNGLLLSGKPGIGKTTMAHVLLKEAGYDIIEFNASEVRSQKVIRDKLLTIVNGSNILKMINKTNKTAIIMDEVDGSSTGEKGVIKELVQYISSAKNYSALSRKKKKIRRKKSSNKDIIINNNPIICVCNQIISGMKSLKEACIHFKISVPSDEQIFQLIKKIKENENIDMDDIVCRTIVPHCQMDLRRTINILENIKMYFKNNKITVKDINKVIKTFGTKDINVGLYTAINNIFGKKMSPNDSLINFQSDKVFVPMLVHENFNKQIRNNFKNSQIEKLDAMYQYYNLISDANIIENELYHTHNWELTDYIGLLTCYSANTIFNSLNPYNIPKYDMINNSPVLSKINYKFYNLKIINLFCKKINLSTTNFQQFTQYIYNNYIFNLYDETTTINMTTYLAKYLEFVDIDKCIKLSYLYQEHIKLYTSKKKKKIEKSFQSIKNKYK